MDAGNSPCTLLSRDGVGLFTDWKVKAGLIVSELDSPPMLNIILLDFSDRRSMPGRSGSFGPVEADQ